MIWLHGILYGLVVGVSEFLPISSESHSRALLEMTGLGDGSLLFAVTARIACIAALILSCWPQISKLRRESRIAAIPPKRRKRQPDQNSLKDIRLIKSALFFSILGIGASLVLPEWCSGIPAMILFTAINGVLLYLPPYYPAGNKKSQRVSMLDGILIGFGGALAIFPGISRISGFTCIGLLRGCDRQYILNIALILSVPLLLLLLLLDVIAFAVAGVTISFLLILGSILCGLAAFAGAYFAIILLRFLSVKAGFSGFAYYSWGLALFALILYLAI